MKYSDYGLTREEARKIIRICRRPDFAYRDLVVSAAKQSNPEIWEHIVRNLCDREYWINSGVYIDERSFYGWRKKCIFLLEPELRKKGLL